MVEATAGAMVAGGDVGGMWVAVGGTEVVRGV